jgi:hypothetical protein
MSEIKRLEGWAAMRAWNPTFKPGHLPAWFKKKIKLRLQLEDEHAYDWEYHFRHKYPTWDHCGSVQFANESRRAVYNMPYHACDESMREFAERHCMDLSIGNQGPWHPNTRLYIFRHTDQYREPFSDWPKNTDAESSAASVK